MPRADGPEWRNWSGLYQARPARVQTPATVEEVSDAVKAAARDGLRVKPTGSGHSFSPIATPEGLQLRMQGLDRLIDVDGTSGLVTVGAGIPLHQLTPLLAEHGLAMENLGDIDRQTISGATSTGTHGTGGRFGGIATQIRGLELVLADGSVVRCSATERPELFEFARVGLGAFGVITAITLQCVPAFALQVIDEPMPLDRVLEELDDLITANDHFEYFWFPHTDRALTRRFTRVPADTERKPIGKFAKWLDEDIVTNFGWDKLLRAGSRFPRLIPRINRVVAGSLSKHEYTDLAHLVFASRRDVRFNEGEYAFARERFREVFAECRAVSERQEHPVSFPLECRFVAADDIPLAPTYQRTSGYIAFHQYHRMPHQPFFDQIEDVFATVDGRPHWGKMHRLDATRLRELYPRFDEFVALRDRLDPSGVFTNKDLNRVLGSPPGV